MALIPFHVQIVAKRLDRSRINVMRSVHENKPDSRGLDPAIQRKGIFSWTAGSRPGKGRCRLADTAPSAFLACKGRSLGL
jgi:hypothetical protein